MVAETQEEMERHIRQVGAVAAQEANVPGLHDKLLDYLGRLKFRTSYSQNVLQHSIEVAYLTGLLAEEIGMNGALGRRCGLLHDIGKAADHEMEGGHPAIGAELTKRYGEGKEVIHAALGHHDDLRTDTPYTVLVAAADAISASRLERVARRWINMSAASKTSKPWPAVSPESSKPTRSRRVERSRSSPIATAWETRPPPSSAETSPRPSRSS